MHISFSRLYFWFLTLCFFVSQLFILESLNSLVTKGGLTLRANLIHRKDSVESAIRTFHITLFF